MTPEERIKRALEIAIESAGVDGGHHKMWVIDQMIRALTGCPTIEVTRISAYGKPIVSEEQGVSDEYLAWVQAFCDGEDGPETYEWDTGVAP